MIQIYTNEKKMMYNTPSDFISTIVAIKEEIINKMPNFVELLRASKIYDIIKLLSAAEK